MHHCIIINHIPYGLSGARGRQRLAEDWLRYNGHNYDDDDKIAGSRASSTFNLVALSQTQRERKKIDRSYIFLNTAAGPRGARSGFLSFQEVKYISR